MSSHAILSVIPGCRFASGSSTAPVDLVEPDVTLSKSTVSPTDGFVDAADPVISRLTIDHSPTSTAYSYTNVITDTLPAGLSWDNDYGAVNRGVGKGPIHICN